uniref:Uncharacterized protein n=1 Tax=Schizaphis graminum TaxID=13262 RepID=A0A2S2NIJ0_SCHGA
MFVLSKTVISVLAFTVILNVFYFDPTYSAESNLTHFSSCGDCMDSQCHTNMLLACIVLPDNSTFTCLQCNSNVENGDSQFYCKSDCEAECSNKAACTCDGSCYVCALKTDPKTLKCAMTTYLVGNYSFDDDDCTFLPYVSTRC